MNDDILDDMLDSLADDMLMEMAEEEVQPAAPAVPPSWARGAVTTPNMPDLGQMMSQMMPMMSQMFGGNGSANPMFGGGANSLQQPPVSWQDLVRRHVPAGEQEDWLTTIDRDATKLRVASAAQTLAKPHSRSYRTKPSAMPNVYMQVGTMLANMLNEAVRSSQLEHNRQWQELRDGLVSQLAQTGMSQVYEDKFKDMLRQRVANDPDYLAEKDSERYRNITEALAVLHFSIPAAACHHGELWSVIMQWFWAVWRPALRRGVSRWSVAALSALLLSSLCWWQLSELAEMDHALVRGLPSGIRSCWCVELEGHIDSHYHRPEACVTARKRTESITELVRIFGAMLDKRDVDYWVDSGTLLGQFRKQSVIPWDDDTDFGMTMEGYEKLRDNHWTVPDGYELQVYDSKIHRARDRDWNIPARLVDKTYGFYVDVFVFVESEANGVEMLGTHPSSCWHACSKCLQIDRYAKLLLISRYYVFPLLSCPFAGFRVLCPARRTLYLEHLYGPNFRIPRST
ncbi:hypothetical protein PF008_g10166 [Phytophthora fragariae]|uniref:LicD/FKTN/FKRP nucleotidyltransferase domain-containing protein n=1 Tax=Phytophthora fragariae TaxID=53985 RepID=A0A6G0RUL1_9STRA|nr:hypothetical protein PF008_g10166 [Phytophthora fragariae]